MISPEQNDSPLTPKERHWDLHDWKRFHNRANTVSCSWYAHFIDLSDATGMDAIYCVNSPAVDCFRFLSLRDWALLRNSCTKCPVTVKGQRRCASASVLH